MSENIHFIGMDLGTFKTSVVASDGERASVQSCVGWAKDHVARTMLRRETLFGDEARRRRLAVNLVRPFQRGGLKYLDSEEAGVPADAIDTYKQAAELLVQHAVSLVKPPAGAKIYGVIGAPSRASILNKQTILEAASKAFDTAMIVPEPFAVAYGMNHFSDALIVDIGAGTVDLCPMYGSYPSEEDQITLPIGGETIDEELFALIKATYPKAQLSINMAREIKEKHALVAGAGDRVTIQLPVAGKPQPFDVTDLLIDACSTIVNPIADAIKEFLGKFDPEFHRCMLDNILLAGGGSQIRGLDRMLEDSLAPFGGARVSKVHDSTFACATGALKLAMHTPAANWEAVKTAAAA